MARSFSHPIQTVTNLPLALAFYRSSLARRCTASMRRKWSPDDSRFVEPHHILRARSGILPRSAASCLSVVTDFREIS